MLICNLVVSTCVEFSSFLLSEAVICEKIYIRVNEIILQFYTLRSFHAEQKSLNVMLGKQTFNRVSTKNDKEYM